MGLKADSMIAARKAANSKIFWIAALAMSFGAVGTLLLASFLTAPVERLAAGVSRLKSGHKEVEIKITFRDELGELTRSFNEMSKMLLAQQESLTTYSKNLEESYTSILHAVQISSWSRALFHIARAGLMMPYIYGTGSWPLIRTTRPAAMQFRQPEPSRATWKKWATEPKSSRDNPKISAYAPMAPAIKSPTILLNCEGFSTLPPSAITARS